MTIATRSRFAVAAACLGMCMPAALVVAQQNPAAGGQEQYDRADQVQDLNDFVHYVWIAKPELAKGHLRRLFDSGITNAELADLVREQVTEERFASTIARARVIAGMEDIIAELESRVLGGARDSARDPQRIKDAIAMLDGTLRQQHYGQDILKEAGEYAVPYLLKYVTGGENPTIKQRCLDVLGEIKSPAVYPLSVAVSKLDATSQVQIINLLGRIGHSGAGPYLSEIAADSSAPPSVREAAQTAARRLGADPANLATDFTVLARRYLESPASLTAYPNEASNNAWSYDVAAGLLVPTKVSTAIFGDVLAMTLSKRALKYDPGYSAALATFIAADLKRENDLPQGESDPIYGESEFSAEFYAVGAGPSIIQEVLAMALRMGDTPLIRDAIAALKKTAGGSNLFAGGGAAPLLQALQYPDRRVRYDAALALGQALPTSGFPGDFTVVPLLAEAVRAGGTAYALVVASDQEDQRTYSDWLTRKGYQVVAQVANVSDARQLIAQSSGVDVVVVKQTGSAIRATIGELDRSPRTSVAPVVVLTELTELQALAGEYQDEARVVIKETPRSEEGFSEVVDKAVAQASGGPMDEGDALAYSLESIGTLLDVAISNSPIYSIKDAESALIDALKTKQGSIRLATADVLAHIDSDAAQRALFDAAFAASGAEQIDLLRRVADSAKRWGDRAEERHITRLLELVKQGGELGEAAAAVHGALNLGPENVVRIIAD